MLPVVLLVEDDPMLLRTYGRALRSNLYELELVRTPAQALSEALQAGERLKLLITDQNLNGRGEALAHDLCRRLPQLQVLILSGESGLVVEGYEVLEKPFSLEVLRTKVLEKLDILG
jgi:DNA-binding response OmpR family regulator